jgi:hypothetical protein
MTINDSGVAELADELSITTLTGAYDLIGSLTYNPVIIIFDNQGTVPVEISNNGTSTWKTFPAGEALVLDLRDKKGLAANYTFRKGMKFYGKGTAGACDFKISYTYAAEI